MHGGTELLLAPSGTRVKQSADLCWLHSVDPVHPLAYNRKSEMERI
jgi:hypothetical protein